MLFALKDVASSDDPPALAALHHLYRAVYLPDARVALAWGMEEEDWRSFDRGRQATAEKPDWMPKEWTSARPRFAHVLLNGAMVWQVTYASINWGAGISGCLPWPSARFDENRHVEDVPAVLGWETTRWEVEFARLLDDLGSNGFKFDAELERLKWRLHDIHPIDAERAGM